LVLRWHSLTVRQLFDHHTRASPGPRVWSGRMWQRVGSARVAAVRIPGGGGVFLRVGCALAAGTSTETCYCPFRRRYALASIRSRRRPARAGGGGTVRRVEHVRAGGCPAAAAEQERKRSVKGKEV